MLMRKLATVALMSVCWLPTVSTARQTDRARQGTPTLTAADRHEIELLIARYALALGTCDSEKYAGLFAEPDGYFTSGIRGKVQGHRRLVEMNKSYNCVYTDGVAPPRAPAVMVPYKFMIEVSPSGAVGTAFYNGGHYEDVYVKTSDGWRFGSRTVVTNQERAAGLSAADFDAILELTANNGGPYADVYEPFPGGLRFKSSGVIVEPTIGGAKATAYLKDGARYEDVYVKTPQGWRLKSRTRVVAAPGAEDRPGAAPR